MLTKLIVKEMCNLKKLEEMLEIQAHTNDEMNPSWRCGNTQWYRSIWVSSAEIMNNVDHDFDYGRLRLTMIAIWQQIMNWALTDGGNEVLLRELCSETNRHWTVRGTSLAGLRREIDNLAINALSLDFWRMVFVYFRILKHYKMETDFDLLYRYYVGNYVLNCFRRDKNYGSWRYDLAWNLMSDADHLDEIILNRKGSDDFAADVYNDLDARYVSFDIQIANCTAPPHVVRNFVD